MIFSYSLKLLYLFIIKMALPLWLFRWWCCRTLKLSHDRHSSTGCGFWLTALIQIKWSAYAYIESLTQQAIHAWKCMNSLQQPTTVLCRTGNDNGKSGTVRWHLEGMHHTSSAHTTRLHEGQSHRLSEGRAWYVLLSSLLTAMNQTTLSQL